MDVKEIHPLLKPFIPNGNSPNVVYDSALQIIFGNLIAEYLGKKLNDETPNRLKTTLGKFFDEEINLWIEQNGQVVQERNFIKDHYLRNLYSLAKKKITEPKETLRLTVIFNFLSERIQIETVNHWVNKAEKEQEKIKSNRKIEFNSSVNGAIIISDQFLNSLGTDVISPYQFYLAKDEGDLQWRGIINDWDMPRSKYPRLLSKVKGSFLKKDFQNNIAAVVLGQGGSGKSTLLRHLAYRLRNVYVVLWVTSLTNFNDNLKELHPAHKYLLIVEDWDRVAKEISKSYDFLDSIEQMKNVRLVIGDRNSEGKIYDDKVADKNTFTLTAQENPKILSWVLGKYPPWASTFKTVFKNKNLYQASLYLILFILGRTHVMNNKKEFGKILNIENKFQAIIAFDISTLEKKFPRLGKTLSICAKLNISQNIMLTWDAFWVLANEACFNGANVLFDFNTDDEIYEILSYYIHKAPIHNLLVPQIYPLQFHHDLLIEEVAKYPTKEVGEVKLETIKKIYTELIKHKQWHAAAGFKLARISSKTIPDVYFRSSVFSLIEFGNTLQRMISEESKDKVEWEWEVELIKLLHFRISYPLDDYAFKKILEVLVKNGCDANCIKQTLLKADDLLSLKALFTYHISRAILYFPNSKYFRELHKQYKSSREKGKTLLIP